MTSIVSSAARLLLSVAAGVTLAAAPLRADAPRASKDVGPVSAACDAHAKGSAAWSACVGQPVAGAMSNAELFYAGYWLAKNGRYDDALGYLTRADQGDERVLTYIGFATRKLGHVDEALPLYRKALEINADYAVARAYMGEAYLSKDQPEMARRELAEIGQRCGTTCPSYVDLDGHIRAYDARAHKG